MPKPPKRPRDMMQLAKLIGELATGEGIKTTPAMAAGVADHVWKLEEVVGLLD